MKHREKRKLKERLFRKQGGKCACCEKGMTLRVQGFPDSAESDHIKAKSHNGPDSDSNFQLLRRGCNGKKSGMDNEVYKNLYTSEQGTLKVKAA